MSFLVLFNDTYEVSARAHNAIKFDDGNATRSNGYRPHIDAGDVNSTIKNRWERNNLTNFVRGEIIKLGYRYFFTCDEWKVIDGCKKYI